MCKNGKILDNMNKDRCFKPREIGVKMKNTLAQRLKELREEKRWSKTEVADQLRIKTLSTYANWEYGIRSPDYDTLIKIAKLYGVSTDYLLGLTDWREPVKEGEEEKAFLRNISHPDLKRWFIGLSTADQDDLEKLRIMWKLIKGEKITLEDCD